eukprot:g2061.t1
MRAILAILGAIAGAVVGYIGAFVVIYPILVAIEGRDMNGGIAMGVAFGFGPITAIVMAILFLFLVLRLVKPKPRPAPVIEPHEDPDEKFFRPPPGKSPGPDTQTLVAVGVVVLMIGIGVTWLWGRLFEHQNGLIGGFTSAYNVKRLVYAEEHDRIDDAIGREKQLKSWKRAWKIALIEKSNPEWLDLTATGFDALEQDAGCEDCPGGDQDVDGREADAGDGDAGERQNRDNKQRKGNQENNERRGCQSHGNLQDRETGDPAAARCPRRLSAGSKFCLPPSPAMPGRSGAAT